VTHDRALLYLRTFSFRGNVTIYSDHRCIYILLDTVLASDINKYSLTSARCQQRWRANMGNWIYF